MPTMTFLFMDPMLPLWDRATRRAIGPPLTTRDVQALGITFMHNERLMTGGLDGTRCLLAAEAVIVGDWRLPARRPRPDTGGMAAVPARPVLPARLRRRVAGLMRAV